MLAWAPLQKGLLSEAPQRHSVTRFRFSYRLPSWNSIVIPSRTQSAAAFKLRILYHADGRRKSMLDFFTRLLVMYNQSTRGTVHCFSYNQLAGVRIICLLN